MVWKSIWQELKAIAYVVLTGAVQGFSQGMVLPTMLHSSGADCQLDAS